MAQARYDWNKAKPKEPPSVLTASPRERAVAVARTPGAAESMAQAVHAWNKSKPKPPKPPARGAQPQGGMMRNKLDAADGTPQAPRPIVQDAATRAALAPARARGAEINARVAAKQKAKATAKKSQQKRTAGKRSA